MGLISTPFISFQDIEVEEIDLYSDAWGFNSEFGEVINLLEKVEFAPDKTLTDRLLKKIRKHSV